MIEADESVDLLGPGGERGEDFLDRPDEQVNRSALYIGLWINAYSAAAELAFTQRSSDL